MSEQSNTQEKSAYLTILKLVKKLCVICNRNYDEEIVGVFFDYAREDVNKNKFSFLVNSSFVPIRQTSRFRYFRESVPSAADKT